MTLLSLVASANGVKVAVAACATAPGFPDWVICGLMEVIVAALGVSVALSAAVALPGAGIIATAVGVAVALTSPVTSLTMRAVLVASITPGAVGSAAM